MMSPARVGDVRRWAGWLPEQEDLEDWLAGHRERVEAKRVVLRPVLVEFQELIDSDPVVRMYLHQMIEQVPRTRRYRKRRLQSVPQLLRLINAVLRMAPEYGESTVATPLGAFLDWTMGTAAGFAAYREPRINATLEKVLTAWCTAAPTPAQLVIVIPFPLVVWGADELARLVRRHRHTPRPRTLVSQARRVALSGLWRLSAAHTAPGEPRCRWPAEP